MKKILFAFAITVLAFTSCTPDDNNNTIASAGGILPSKIVTTYSGGQVSTSTFAYLGNKIIEEIIVPAEDISKRKYTYTGDNITKIEQFAGSKFDAFGGEILTYENGKVKTSTSIAVAGYVADLQKETFTYNTDGTVLKTTSFINQTTGKETASGRQMRYTYASGLLTKTESISGGVVGQVTNYTNEAGKNQAFKNVLGFDQTIAPGNLRLSTVYVGSGNPGETFTYTYNSDNYPSQVVQPNAFGTQSKTQVFTY
jgi:YD repeat-containing protein